ncbi:MAG TPA: VOC family protein [Solirubrobacteraceae bacterium]|nr:VOC family protein [Solirubrobacteraceae bacterium]
MSTATDVRTYPTGVPCWVDIEQPDPEAACAFYAELLGWTCTDVTPPEVSDSYWIATVEGRDVAALAPSTGAPVAWNTYIAVDDVDRTAALVAAQGGAVSGEPADVGPAGRAGRLAICTDPEGAGFRLWKAGARLGAQLVNVPGTWNFSHLRTGDLDRARGFYEPLFGWRHSTMPGEVEMWRVPGYGDHLAATSDPEIYARQAGAPEGFADVVAGAEHLDDSSGTPRWKVVFSVADRDQTTAAAERVGAEVLSSRETMWTREADLRDPQGAELTISQFAPPT